MVYRMGLSYTVCISWFNCWYSVHILLRFVHIRDYGVMWVCYVHEVMQARMYALVICESMTKHL